MIDEREEKLEIGDKLSRNINEQNLLEKSGVIFSNLTGDLKNRFNIDENINGLLVVELILDDPNIKLRTGDIILAIDQESVTNVNQFNLIYEKLKSNNKKSAILLVKRTDFSMFMALPIK